MKVPCPTCGRLGRVPKPFPPGAVIGYSGPNGETVPYETCRTCNGQGWMEQGGLGRMTPIDSPVPVQDVLNDRSHPWHDAVKDTVERLKEGSISMCACMGPMYGEPYCHCEMERRGIPPSPAHIAASEKAEHDLSKLFKFFHQTDQT